MATHRGVAIFSIRRSLAGLVLLATFLIGSCSDGRSPLVLYSPHGRDLLTVIEEAYEARRPDIDVRWLDMGSQEVLDRIRSERANPQADVWFGGPSVLFSRAAGDGLLASSSPSWTAGLAERSRDPEGRYYSLYLTPTLIVYNPEAVSEEEAPQDWGDLLDERWNDRVLIRDPLASGTMRTIFGHLIDSLGDDPEEGFDWLRQLDAQTKEYVHSPALLHEKIIRQEGEVTVWEMTDILSLISRGAPLAYRFPASGAPVIEDSIALVAGAQHEVEALDFLEWVGSEEALQIAAEKGFRLPASTSIEASKLPDWVQEVRASLVVADVDWEELERSGRDWMANWDRTVRGRGRD